MRSRLAQRDQKILWHPFTQHTEWDRQDPIVIASAKGVWLTDDQGRKLLDGNSSLWVNVWGHNHPALNRALNRQLSRLAHSTFLGLSHEPAIHLAEELLRIAPKNLSRVFYSDNGSTAAEVALKMAYQYWQLRGEKKRTRFVSLKNGYHGDTIGSVSVGGVDLFHARFRDLLFKGFQVHPQYRHPGNPSAGIHKNNGIDGPRLTIRRGDDMERIFRKHHASISAVVMEPLVQGASGMLLMKKGYLKHVERLCRKYGVLLIVDEVATGFGRTGTMFAVEQEKVQPDFLCVAKSLTAGYLPLAATLTTDAVYRAFLGRFDEFKAFFHGHTYTANPLACAVALENLALYKKRNLLANVRARARQLAAGLKSLSTHPSVVDIRQTGLMCGIEIGPYPPAQRMGLRVCEEAIRRGVWLRPLGNVIVLVPPLVVTEPEMRFLIRTVIASVDAVCGRKPG